MASSKHPLHQHSQGYIMSYRRPPVMRRTATTVLAGGPCSGWHNPSDLELLKLDSEPQWDDTATLISESAMNSAAAQPLRFSSSESTQTPTIATTGRRKSNARAKQKLKQAEPVKAVIDLGASIIPICAPGTGTPPPQPPQSYASSSSLTRLDFDTGASSRVDEEEEEYLTAAMVGKRSRARSISSQHSTRLPISPPVTSPNTSTFELPLFTPTSKRAREGRESVRRKRRKTTSSMVSTSTRGDEAVSLGPIVKPVKAPREREPPRRKGWKGWVMVSDTEGSDTERPDTSPVVILDKRTRSGRDFDQELTLVQRRARSRASTRTESVAPPSSSGIAT
ncbi:hypothetical protein RSOL_504090 [Rhizoctonia solani AG-3 Rhs1AP]|uniref:Uncharacterized protein n=2 Tax=Rhizoctonia solani AG-3 TaxID=1086053 RepID=A0A074RK15_9AGAM|nr:hypothetical protein RSOL_504090 [Rhizoctonia solani AG-3 Rhs1AP]KEP47436.1 hypothetical protein V565_155790 [Rhizoctonia solani 123E]